MRERPILLQGDMVRATIDGVKNQTRRPIKGVVNGRADDWGSRPYCPGFDEPTQTWNWTADLGEAQHARLACPYGVAGDRLWVKESWRELGSGQRKDGKIPDGPCDVVYRADEGNGTVNGGPWRPSIHMPRWASRLLLEILNVRVQRIQEITEDDILAEGVRLPGNADGHPLFDLSSNLISYMPNGFNTDTYDIHAHLRGRFGQLWDSINGKPKPAKTHPLTREKLVCYVSYPWDEAHADPRSEIRGLPHFCFPNPWVWALGFKMIENKTAKAAA